MFYLLPLSLFLLMLHFNTDSCKSALKHHHSITDTNLQCKLDNETESNRMQASKSLRHMGTAAVLGLCPQTFVYILQNPGILFASDRKSVV